MPVAQKKRPVKRPAATRKRLRLVGDNRAEFREGFGGRLRRWRLEHLMTQPELAEKCGVSVATVCRWERGHNEPDFAARRELAKVLGQSVEEAFGIDAGDWSSN